LEFVVWRTGRPLSASSHFTVHKTSHWSRSRQKQRRTTGVGCHLSAAHGFSQKPRTRRSRAGRRACHFFVRLPLPKPGLAGPVHHRRDTSLALLWTGHIRYCGFHPFLFFDRRRSNMEYKQLATTSTVLRYEHPAINALFARLIATRLQYFCLRTNQPSAISTFLYEKTSTSHRPFNHPPHSQLSQWWWLKI
jgi:hypothetical protein